MRVVVVGGGVIGLACAYELAKQAVDVTIVERGEAGRGASWGNGGWIVPSLCDPIPSPGVPVQSLKWLLKKNSPLRLEPRADAGFLRWGMSFLSHCDRKSFSHGRAAFSVLNQKTRALFDEWHDAGLEFEMHHSGLVFAFRSPQYLDHALEAMLSRPDRWLDAPQRLTASDLRDLVPMLSPSNAGGFIMPGERHVEPYSVCRALTAAVRGMGGAVREGVQVSGFIREGPWVRAVRTAGEPIEADHFVIAAGVWTSALVGKLGFRVPLEAGKGYSITVRQPDPRLKNPVYLGEARTGLSPFDRGFRLAGMMQLVGLNDRVDAQSVQTLRAVSATYLSSAVAGSHETVWCGFRPLAPDGLPVMGMAPGLQNVAVATGHGMLGVTLAPASGRAISHLICDGALPASLEPFSPARFQMWRR